MLYIGAKGDIRLTRGDTARFTVPIANETDGSEYVLASGDTLTFTVKEDANDADALIVKTLKGSNQIHIAPADTAGLEFKKYIYDVQLTTASGDVYTVIEPITFEVMKEVSW